MTWIKICGVTHVDDAEHVVRSGANAIGLNFVHGSKRRVTYDQARPIIEAVRGRIELVAVVANPTDAEVKLLSERSPARAPKGASPQPALAADGD